MKLVETTKFKKLRKRIKEDKEKKALRRAIIRVKENPDLGKKLKGEFKDLRSFAYTVQVKSRRLIYKSEPGMIVLFSFGPREGIYR